MSTHRSSGAPLTEDQLAREERNAAKGLYNDVKPAQLFGPKSSSMLGSQVYFERPGLYMRLRQEYKYISGQERRPLEGVEE